MPYGRFSISGLTRNMFICFGDYICRPQGHYVCYVRSESDGGCWVRSDGHIFILTTAVLNARINTGATMKRRLLLLRVRWRHVKGE